MRNALLNELQVGIKVGVRNINNLRYGGGSILMAENEEQLKSLLMSMKEESERTDLRLNKQTNKQLRSWHLAPLLHGKQKGKRWKQ